MKDYSHESMPVPGMDAVRSVSSHSPNDGARNQTANKDPNRYCINTPPVPTGGDSMEKTNKGRY